MSVMEELRIVPNPKLSRMFVRMANSHTSIGSAINELTDNAIDAGASYVKVVLDNEKHTISIMDDGKGIERDVEEIRKIVSFNAEKQNSRGRYGIGQAEACRSLIDMENGYYEVESIARLSHSGIWIRFPSYKEVDEIEKQGKEFNFTPKFDVPRTEFKEKGIKNGGTIVTIFSVRKRLNDRAVKTIKDAIAGANDIIIRDDTVQFQVGLQGKELETVEVPPISWVGDSVDKPLNVFDSGKLVGSVEIRSGVVSDSGSAGVYTVLNGRCIEKGNGLNFNRNVTGADYFRLEVHVPPGFIEITPQKDSFVEDSINYIKTTENILSDPDVIRLMNYASTYEQERTDKERIDAFSKTFSEMVKDMPDLVKSIFRAGRGDKQRVLRLLGKGYTRDGGNPTNIKNKSDEKMGGESDEEGPNVVMPDFKVASFPREPQLLVIMHKEKSQLYLRVNNAFYKYNNLDMKPLSRDWFEIIAEGLEHYMLTDENYKKYELKPADVIKTINKVRFHYLNIKK